MNLDELKVYNLSMEMGEDVWNIVIKWDFFAKDTLGKQLVRSADSVAANISEGFGRFHYKENMNFCYFSRGSLYETKTWLTKAHKRNLIDDEKFNCFSEQIITVARLLNGYIKSIGNTTNVVKEPESDYEIDPWILDKDPSSSTNNNE